MPRSAWWACASAARAPCRDGGTIRVTNEDGLPHFAIAFPLRRGVTAARLGRALRSESEAAFGRILAGAPYSLQASSAAGARPTTTRSSFTRAGRYGLVCFIDGHHHLGMYRIVTVR